MRQTRLVIVAMAAALSACASDYGGSLASNQDVLSPEERRLQALENHVAQMQRRLDAVTASNLDQQSQQTRQDVSQLRGDLEKLRYDFDQSQRKQADLEARLQRLEAGSAGAAPGVAGSYVPQNGAVPAGAPAMPGAAAATAPDNQGIPVVTPAQTPGQPAVAAAAGGTTLSSGSGNSPQEEAAYLSAFDALKNGKYDDALNGFRAQLEKWPQGRYADNALYWSGEAYYVKADYKSALAAFQAVLQRFPRSAKAPDAMLKSGLVQMDMGQTSAGKATLQKVVSTYPQSNAASLARQRLQSK